MLAQLTGFRWLLVLTACCFSSFLQAQVSKNVFFVKGKITNAQSDSIGIFIDDIFYQQRYRVPVDKRGEFQKEFFINGPAVFYLANDASQIARFFVSANDTIDLNIDGITCKVTHLVANNGEATKAYRFQVKYFEAFPLEKMWKLQKKNYALADSLRHILSNRDQRVTKMSANDSIQKAEAVTAIKKEITGSYESLYQKQLLFVLKNYYWGKNVQVLIDDLYFSFLSNIWRSLLRDKLTENIVMKAPDGKELPPAARKLIPPPDYYKKIDIGLVRRTNAYRGFLFYDVRFGRTLPDSIAKKFRELNYDKSGSNFATREYLQGLGILEKYPDVRDWYLAESIKFSFESYNMEETEKLYYDFIKRTGDSDFKDNLIAFYSGFAKFKPGNPAPDFTLKDENGKNVSLKDFRGKVVYIDFWGVHCSPCIAEIKKEVPALHEKYKNKEVVFVNICVDESEKVWKEKIKELKLTGINVRALVPNAITTDYAISAIPHHILIDKKGNFINYNADMSTNLGDGDENEIDKALKE